MKNIASVLVIDKNKLSSDRAWLVALVVGVIDPVSGANIETLRLVRNDEIVLIDGEQFEPFPFEIEIEESEGIPTVNVTIQDQTQTVQSRMDQYGGGVGFDVTVMVVSGDSVLTIGAEPELTEEFKVTGASVSNYVVTWELGVGNPLHVSFPRRKQYTDQCSFRYKGAECKYAGALPSCDLTLGGANGCRAHGNAGNFGGVPGVKIRG